jgi:hypothetical protein
LSGLMPGLDGDSRKITRTVSAASKLTSAPALNLVLNRTATWQKPVAS